jgi:Macroglobulin domain MG3
LPTYSIKIELPDRVAIPDEVFQAKVIASYTFGEAVEGEAVVTFWKTVWDWVQDQDDGGWGGGWWNWWQPRGHYVERRVDLLIKTVTINTAAEIFDVNIANDLQIYNAEQINVHVKFTESSTKKVLETSTVLSIEQYAYETIVTGSDLLVANQPYNIKVSSRKIGSGTPVRFCTLPTISF